MKQKEITELETKLFLRWSSLEISGIETATRVVDNRFTMLDSVALALVLSKSFQNLRFSQREFPKVCVQTVFKQFFRIVTDSNYD